MKLSVSAYRAHASAHKKILSSSYHSQLNYGSTAAAAASSSAPSGLFTMDPSGSSQQNIASTVTSPNVLSPTGTIVSANGTSAATTKDCEDDSSNAPSSGSKSPNQRKSNSSRMGHGDASHNKDDDWTKSNQRWMKLRTTVQISSAIQKKPPLKREDSFLKRFSTRQIPETQETVEDTGSESASGEHDKGAKRRRRYLQKRRSVVNPDENFYFHWLMVLTFCILYNLWALIVRQSFPELQDSVSRFWFVCDCLTDIVFVLDIAVQLRTGYLEQGLMVYDDKKLACHYMRSRAFLLDLMALTPLDLLQIKYGSQPLLRFPRFLKVYRSVKFYYIVESRTVWPNLWRVVNLIHILLILAHWFGCFYYLLSEAEGFQGDWVYPYRPGDYATLTRKYLGSLYWSTLTLTTIGDLPTPETNVEPSNSADGPRSLPRRGLKSRLLQFASNYGYVFTIVSYLIGVFIFATIVGQVGNVITNRNANRLEFERLLDGAKTYMRHHKVPSGMKKRVLRWYDYSWSRGRIQGGGDINTALGLLPDKLKTELALHVNLSVLKKVTIFQECQPEFLHDLVLKMKAYIFTPGDSICRKGEVAREMFIIADGILEVLSETGKVLTTMKAGDFFGEIGILNLDGLNKRTADVRSVGYSELFSLSREDVLAAMKDYPEAQEILQTLGRKRLMEVRCVNKKHAKAAAEKEAAHHHHHHHGHNNNENIGQSDNSNENSASKRIVDRIRYDVKGIKSVLKKTRTSRRSDESLEMQLLQGSETNSGLRSSKNLLKRMSRVKSDETQSGSEDHSDAKEKLPSPIGAGLPLLQRLRLLKEKQDREDRAVKSTPLKSPPHTYVTSTVSPQESIQEEPEPEVIGAGLPLLQRLHLLKQREEKSSKSSEVKPPIASEITTANIERTLIEPLLNSDIQTITTPTLTMTTNTKDNVPSHPPKPALKVSFKEKLQELQKQTNNIVKEESESTSSEKEPSHSGTMITTSTTTMTTTSTTNMLTTMAMTTIPHKFVSKPSEIQSFVEPLNNVQQQQQQELNDLKPWSKLKLATIGTSLSYTSLTNCLVKEGLSKGTRTGSVSDLSILAQQQSGSNIGYINLHKNGHQRQQQKPQQQQHQPQTSIKNPVKTKRLTPIMTKKKTKSYKSIGDLSPEYNGLPFVKKLKILYERQKLAELENAMQTRSFSLDCSEAATNQSEFAETLQRSHSDASGISSFKPKMNLLNSPIVPVAPLNISQCLCSPLSPSELSETAERRKLKSILKKINEDKAMNMSTLDVAKRKQTSDELKRLLTSPTVQGYVARHSKLMKTVTFNSTLSSPPSYTNISESSTGDSGGGGGIGATRNRFTFTPDDAMDAYKLSSEDQISTTVNNNIHQKGLSIKDFDELSCKKPFKGLTDDQEYFTEILKGINTAIVAHIQEMHKKFQIRFTNLESEIKKRDNIISELQERIRELECRTTDDKLFSQGSEKTTGHNSTETYSSASSAELLFMRGDSADTILSSSMPSDLYDGRDIKKEIQQKCPIARFRSFSEDSSCSTRLEEDSTIPTRSGYKGLIVSDLTGNLTRISDSVILDIDESTSSSSSSSNLDQLEEDPTTTTTTAAAAAAATKKQPAKIHCNDWEVRMLAAELDRRENKRERAQSENLADLGKYENLLRRRRKQNETEFSETEFSETEGELPLRPRAASLDQFNLQHHSRSHRGIFKTTSFDRDKDRL